jgi:hypothetical protein
MIRRKENIMDNPDLTEIKLSLSERLINDVFKQVINQFSNSNEDCHKLSAYLTDNMNTLKDVSPTQLLHGYNLLSQKPNPSDCFQARLQKAFGLDIGNKFYEAVEVIKVVQSDFRI